MKVSKAHFSLRQLLSLLLFFAIGLALLSSLTVSVTINKSGVVEVMGADEQGDVR